MAQPDNTIDPNDLDSIDALLDEAELESDNQQPDPDQMFEEDTPQPDETDADSLSDLDDIDRALDQQVEKQDDQDSELNLDDFELGQLDDQQANAEANQDDLSVGGQDLARIKEQQEFEKLLEKRAQQGLNNNELTVAEMDSLKKMIIGFGSATVGLALILMGISLWGAISASSIEMPDSEIYEQILGEAELARTAGQANQTALADLNRKLDALSFQIEQINGDLVTLTNGVPSANNTSDLLNPLGIQNGATQPYVETAKPESVTPTAAASTPVVQTPVTVQGTVDMTQLEGKVDEVARSLAVAQRRVVEINNRVKTIQKQYTLVLNSVKQVEKTLLEEKLAQKKAVEQQQQAEKEKLEQETKQTSESYHYRAPGALHYEYGSKGTYP